MAQGPAEQAAAGQEVAGGDRAVSAPMLGGPTGSAHLHGAQVRNALAARRWLQAPTSAKSQEDIQCYGRNRAETGPPGAEDSLPYPPAPTRNGPVVGRGTPPLRHTGK